MLGALNSSITGMDAAEMGLDVIGNNIANVNTAAFKAGSISFASVYSDTVSVLGGSSGNELGKGVQVVGISSVWEQGSPETTMNPTDCCIVGNGFFKVLDSSNAAYYTRAGQFEWNQSGELVDPEGRVVQGFDLSAGTPNAGISVDRTTYSDIKIEGQGIVTALNDGTRESLFQLALYDFPAVDSLRKVSGNLYQETTDSGQPVQADGSEPGTDGLGSISTNKLEMSNVNLAREFVNLIVTQKAFQANSRVISSSANMLDDVINIIR